MHDFINAKIAINNYNNSKLFYPPKFYQRLIQGFFYNLISNKQVIKKFKFLFDYLLLTLFSTMRNVKRMFIDHTFTEVKNSKQ